MNVLFALLIGTFVSLPIHGKTIEGAGEATIFQKTRIEQLFGPYSMLTSDPAACVEKNKPSFGPLRTKDGELTAEKLADVVEKTYPKHWADRTLSISQSALSKAQHPLLEKLLEYPMMSGFGFSTIAENDERTITFYKSSNREHLSILINHILSHELAHGNDWHTDNGMTTSERALLLLSVYDRLNAANKYRSPNVELIKDSDPQRKEYRKVSEYWAEIVAQYFDDRSKLSQDDLALVESYVKRTDPDFDQQKAKTLREQIIGTTIKKRGRSQ